MDILCTTSNAFLGALTLSCYVYTPHANVPTSGNTPPKNVPLHLTSPCALGKLLLFSDLGTYVFGPPIYAESEKAGQSDDLGRHRLLVVNLTPQAIISASLLLCFSFFEFFFASQLQP